MLKSIMSWLTGSVPVSGWMLILLLFGCISGVALSLKSLHNKGTEGE